MIRSLTSEESSSVSTRPQRVRAPSFRLQDEQESAAALQQLFQEYREAQQYNEEESEDEDKEEKNEDDGEKENNLNEERKSYERAPRPPLVQWSSDPSPVYSHPFIHSVAPTRIPDVIQTPYSSNIIHYSKENYGRIINH